VRNKLKILGTIHASQPSVALGDDAGLHALPSRDKLKRWYEVDLIESYFEEPQKQMLARFQEVVSREMKRLELQPCIQTHLDRTLEYELYVAPDEEVKRQAREAYNLKKEAYAEWIKWSKFSPEDIELRFKDGLAIKFLRSKGGSVPQTRRETYQDIEDLDQNGWEQFLRDETAKREMILLEEYRQRHPDTATNRVWNYVDESFERYYDKTQELNEYSRRLKEMSVAKQKELEAEMDSMSYLHLEETLNKYPELEADIRRRIALHRWDLSISDEKYDQDEAAMRERKKIWWTKPGDAAEKHH